MIHNFNILAATGLVRQFTQKRATCNFEDCKNPAGVLMTRGNVTAFVCQPCAINAAVFAFMTVSQALKDNLQKFFGAEAEITVTDEGEATKVKVQFGSAARRKTQ